MRSVGGLRDDNKRVPEALLDPATDCQRNGPVPPNNEPSMTWLHRLQLLPYDIVVEALPHIRAKRFKRLRSSGG
jgi:hypothetical protein